MKKLYLIDGHSYCYQTFFALKNLYSPEGIPTNAIYGFIKFISKIIEDDKPDYLIVCFDSTGPTFRHKIYNEYKIQRPKMPDDLNIQIEWIKKILKAYNITILEKQGFEADDILGTIVLKTSKESELEITIFSSDKDIMQVLTKDNIKIYDTKKNNIITLKDIREKFEIEPYQLPDYYALVGDKSDNIPGVKGIGPKQAKKLIKEWENIENLYKNIEKITSKKVRESLISNKENAFLSKKLFLIKTNLNIDFELEKCKLKTPNKELLISLFQTLGFNSFLSKIIEDNNEDIKKYIKKEINNFKDVLKLVDNIKDKQINEVLIDIEYEDSNLWSSGVYGIYLCYFEENKGYFINYIDVEEIEKKDKKTIEDILNILKDIFENKKIGKIGFDLKKDYKILKKYGILLFPLKFDISLATYLLNPSDKEIKLNNIFLKYIGKNIKEENKDKESTYKKFYFLYLVYKKLKHELENKKIYNLLLEIELPLIPILVEMELEGVLVDKHILKNISQRIKKEIDILEKEIYNIAGEKFNISSPKQLGFILFEKLKLPKAKKTKTGYSTSAHVLNELRDKYPIIDKILEYRKLTKLLNTYIEVLPDLVNPLTNRIHTVFHQNATSTGRITSTEPNLQNIPIRSEIGKEIRRAFISKKGYLLLSADYSQIELRILAHFSKDEMLIKAFNNMEDIHTSVASSLFNIKPEEVKEDQRRIAKAVNFGIIYGQTSFGLSEELGISVEKAKKFIEKYFEKYKGVKKFLEEVIESAKKDKYITTILNRRRYIPEINSSSANARKLAERIAINTLMQGSAADIIKKAMINIYNKREKEKLDFKFLIQIHDEILLEVLEKDIDKVKYIVKEEMENCIKLNIPLKVNISIGKNWKDLKKII